jgi:hypothetical protein
MDTAKIVRLVAIIVAVVAGVVNIPQSALIIAVLGLVAGYFVEEDRALQFLVVVLALNVVSGGLNPIPVVGPVLTGIFASISTLFNAAALTVITVGIINRVKP